MEYIFQVRQIAVHEFKIEADDLEEAEVKAQEHVDDTEFNMGDGDYVFEGPEHIQDDGEEA